MSDDVRRIETPRTENTQTNAKSLEAKATPQEVLECLFRPEETVCLRVFNDRGNGIPRKLSFRCDEYAANENDLKQYNAEHYAICFVVNYGGHTNDEITRINAQFVDMDNDSFEAQWKKVREFPLPPSMIIKTQKSLHVYWFNEGGSVERSRGIQWGLVRHFDGDPRCVNESRVMRLPGFFHNKLDTPVEVCCVSFHPERRYTQDQLAAVLPCTDVPDVKNTAKKDLQAEAHEGLDTVLHLCEFLKHCKTNAATLSEPQWLAMITNLICFKGGAKRIHELSSPYPRYSERETQRKIDHVVADGMKPITCQTICDGGFKCPKFENGGCDVKSPAGLWCKPLDVDTLIELVEELPVTGTLIKDLQTAKDFVVTYLHNQNALVAGPIIDEYIRKRLDLPKSSPYLKDLHSAYKELNAKKTKAKADNAATSALLPDWYKATDNGLRFMPGVLAKHMADTQQVFYSAEQYYIYRNGVYCEMSDREAQRMIKDKMIDSEARMTQITDAEKQWRLLILQDLNDLNPNTYIINVKNGLYDVLEDTLKEHTPEYLSTIQLGASYDPAADCPMFRQYLTDAMEGDMEQVRLLQEVMGYCLVPVTNSQKCVVFEGPGGSGKSVFLSTLGKMLSEKNISHVPWQDLNERFKLAELYGKLANIFADLPTRNIDDNGIFKAILGEDYLTGERKFKNPFFFRCSARLIFSCNKVPLNYGDKSEGFYRKLIIIRFNRAIPLSEQDHDLAAKLETELDGILMFALEGLHRLIDNGYIFSTAKKNDDALQEYREASNSILAFVTDCCVVCSDEGMYVGSTELYHSYDAYCKENGLKSYSQKAFVQQLETTYGVERARDPLRKKRVLKGIRLKDDIDWHL